MAATLAAIGPSLAQELPTTQDLEAGRPLVWRGTADARAVSYYPDRASGLAAIPRSAEGYFLQGDSVFDASGESTGRAAVFYPATGLVAGPALACSEFGKQFPPPFNLLFEPCAGAQFPFITSGDTNRPDTATAGALQLGKPGDPISGNSGSGKVHAGRDYVSTDAVINDMVIGGLPSSDPSSLLGQETPIDPSILRVDSMVSRTRQEFEGTVLIVSAEARLSGVKILGGLVEIETILTSSLSRTRGEEPAVTVARVVVNGVSAMGQPARIGSDGITIGQPASGNPFPEANAALQAALQDAGMSISVVGASNATEGNTTMGDAQGVSLHIERTVDAGDLTDNYFADLLLGSVGTNALADPETLAGEEGTDLTDVVDLVPTGSVFDGSTGTATGTDSGTTGVIPPQDPTGPGPTVGGTTGGDGNERPLPTRRAGLLGGLASSRLELLYLAVTLGALGLCLVPKLSFPARLPSPN